MTKSEKTGKSYISRGFRLTIPSTLKFCGTLKNPHTCRKRVGQEVPGVVAALFSKVAGSKYACERLRVYEATKNV